MKLGATGQFPHGKLNADDEGALNMAIAYDEAANVVRVDFGKPVVWFALPPKNALELASLLVTHAMRGKL